MSEMKRATDSEMAMFRAIIALAWADHTLSSEERSRLHAYIAHGRSFGEDQRQALQSECDTPIEVGSVWDDITDPRDRAHVLNVANAIFWEDGELCHTEKEVYDKFKAKHMASLDVDRIRADMVAQREVLLADRERFKRELVEARGPVGRLLHYVERVVDRLT